MQQNYILVWSLTHATGFIAPTFVDIAFVKGEDHDERMAAACSQRSVNLQAQQC